MEFFSQLKSLDTSNLPEYLKILFNEIKPILESIDPDKISGKSKVEIVKKKNDWGVVVEIEPKDERIQGLLLNGFESDLELDYAGTEQLTDMRPTSDNKIIINEVKTKVEAYLEGITVVNSSNKKGKLVKTEYYFGIDTEKDKSKKIGTWYHKFFNKVVSVNKITYKFLK
jgi:hypothetical protein